MLDFAWNDLLNNLLQIGLTVSAAAVLLFSLRKTLKKRYPARAMCIVWAVLALRLLVPVQLTLPDAPVQVTPRTTYLSRTDFAPDQLEQAGLPVLELDGEITTRRWVTDEQAAALGQSGAAEVPSWDVGKLLGMLWGAGALAFAIWQLCRYLAFRHTLTRSSHPAERDTLLTVLDEQKRALGSRRAIPLHVTPAADCPMLAGFVKPALYLPDEALDAADAAFIFRHELTHYKRGDLWLKLALVAARAVHWFNPLVHLLARFAQEDIELACDDAVVRGMDAAARRAYGETILRSVEAQVRRRALVSCFTGDKQTLMRRFEGLFDKNVKRRGVALVAAAAVLVGTLGCAVSVGERNSKPDEETRRALAEQWAQSANLQYGYTVQLDGENTYVLYDHTNTVLWGDQVRQSVPLRICNQLFFEKENGDWQISRVGQIAENGVTSLDEFRLLYENDLGLPDYLMVDWTDPLLDIREPNQAAQNLLHLQIGGIISRLSADEVLGDAIVDLLVEFPDHSEVIITMVNQFDQGWLPQDFTYDGGKNARTAADLAGQYARGVVHKSGQFIYPILTAQKQQEFRTSQQIPGGGFSWKYGGSSPSYRGYTLVPVDDPGSYLAVFQMYGGGVEDMRRAVLVSTAQADGRRVIDRVTEVVESNYTKSNLFKLYYDSGLPWPTIPEDAENFNGASLDTLTRVRDAAETVFGYFGENVEHIEGNQHLYTLESWFTSEVISEGDTEAVVRLTFVDNSPSVDVRMRKTNGYWLPVGLAEQTGDQSAANAGDTGTPDYTITSTAYHNDTYGYTLTLPDCFVGQGYAVGDGSIVQFGLQNALPGYSDDPTDGGAVMTLQVEATAYLQELYGEDWQAEYAIPSKELAERNGLTWYLAFASDVQYDPTDEEITAAYTEMSAAAQAMGADAISFDGQTDEQRTNEQELLLRALARVYAAQNDSTAELIRDKVTILPEVADNAALIVVQFVVPTKDYFFTTAERVWYDRTDTTTPSRTETLINTSGGVRSLEEFWYAFPLEQGLPVFDADGLERLSEMAAKPASLENPDLSTPEACAEYVLHFVGGAWTGRTDSADDDEMRLTYRWDDGEMALRMQRVQLSDSSPALWLPVGYDGWQPQFPPYLSVLARMMDYYPYRTTFELLQALDMSWVDGAYTEGVLAELDKRWQRDADAVENAVAGFGTTVGELWESHKAANPDLFGA